jgi:hypothetical protein
MSGYVRFVTDVLVEDNWAAGMIWDSLAAWPP